MKRRLCITKADEFGNVMVLFFLLNFLSSDLEHWSDPAAAEHPSSTFNEKRVCVSHYCQILFGNYNTLPISF